MNDVYLLLDESREVVALYDNKDLAEKMKKPIEQKFNKKLTIEKRTLNLDIKTIGVFK
jgi:hypothetical protein